MSTQVASLFADLSVSDNSATALAGFEGGLQRAGQKLQTLGDNVTRFGTRLVTTFGPFAALFGLSISKFSSFEEAMRNAHSILGTNEDDMQAINDQILDIGANSRAGPQAVAEAYYDIVSGVQDTTTHLDILNSAIATSEAGNSDLAATTGALVGVMNAYGFTAEQASFASDVFTRTVQMGVLTMDDLAAAFPNVTALAAQMGIPLEDVASSLAFMTTQGVNASVASTQLRQSIVSLINPNTQMAAAIAELGYESGQALIEQEGLVGAMELIGSTSVVADVGLGAVWGSVEGLGAALVLTKDQAAGFISAFEGMGEMWDGVEFEAPRFGGSGAQAAQDWLDSQGGIAGATSSAQEIQMSGPAAQLDLLRSSVDELAIRIGEALVPALQDIMTTIGPVVEDVTEWASENPKLVSSVGLLFMGLTLLGTVLIPLGSLLSVGGTLLTGIGWLTGASGLTAASNGFTLLGTTIASTVLAPLGLLTLGFLALDNNWGGVNDSADETIEKFASGDLVGGFEKLIETLLRFPYGIAIELGSIAGVDVEGGLAAWPGVFDLVIALIIGLGEKAIGAAGALLDMASIDLDFSGFAGMFSPAISAIQGVINKAAEAINSVTRLAGMGDVFDTSREMTDEELDAWYEENVGPAGSTTLPPGLIPPGMEYNDAGELVESQDDGGFALAGSANIIGTGAQPEAFIPTTNGMFVPNIDEVLAGGGRGGNVMIINVNNPQFNGVQDIRTFYDQMKREGKRRAPMGISG